MGLLRIGVSRSKNELQRVKMLKMLGDRSVEFYDCFRLFLVVIQFAQFIWDVPTVEGGVLLDPRVEIVRDVNIARLFIF